MLKHSKPDLSVFFQPFIELVLNAPDIDGVFQAGTIPLAKTLEGTVQNRVYVFSMYLG